MTSSKESRKIPPLPRLDVYSYKWDFKNTILNFKTGFKPSYSFYHKYSEQILSNND